MPWVLDMLAFVLFSGCVFAGLDCVRTDFGNSNARNTHIFDPGLLVLDDVDSAPIRIRQVIFDHTDAGNVEPLSFLDGLGAFGHWRVSGGLATG